MDQWYSLTVHKHMYAQGLGVIVIDYMWPLAFIDFYYLSIFEYFDNMTKEVHTFEIFYL